MSWVLPFPLGIRWDMGPFVPGCLVKSDMDPSYPQTMRWHHFRRLPRERNSGLFSTHTALPQAFLSSLVWSESNLSLDAQNVPICFNPVLC